MLNTCHRCSRTEYTEIKPPARADVLPLGWATVMVATMPTKSHTLCPRCTRDLSTFLSTPPEVKSD